MPFFLSPAKINLHLQVTGKRPDGYHNLRMLMSKISIYDEMLIDIGGDSIKFSCTDPKVPSGKDNIAVRAANLFLKEANLKRGVNIHLKKTIPMGGGLGGGSSNAATVLMALNTLTGSRISDERLREMGLSLGADVPFFIFKGPALAEGVGEKLKAINDMPTIWLNLINPGIEVPTADVFKNLNLKLTKKPKNLNIDGFNHSLHKVFSILHNDLEMVTMERYPLVREALNLIDEEGHAEGVLMSGSGATVFGLYSDEARARKSAETLGMECDIKKWALFTAHTICD